MWAKAYKGIEVYRSVAATTTVNGAAVDLLGYPDVGRREMKVLCDLGTLTTTTTVTVSITNSTNTTTFTAPQYGTTSAVLAAAGLQEFNFRADYRYIRAEIVANATGSFPISIVAVTLQREAS